MAKGNGIVVKVFNDDIEGALRLLKKKIKNSNLIVQLQKKEFYRKPSEINREKRHKANRRREIL
jgi:small subunit ribosomal protein S21